MKVYYVKEIQLSEGYAEVDPDWVQYNDTGADPDCPSVLSRKDIIDIAKEMGISADELKEGE